MKIAVCELPDEASRREAAWTDLVRFLVATPADVVVLPEMPFCEWKMFRTRSIDPIIWQEALRLHDAMIARFSELRADVVLSSRPVQLQGKRLNQAFSWTRADGYRGAHSKYYLPDQPDGWEATWFAQGDRDFAPLAVGPVSVGFQLCTELLFVMSGCFVASANRRPTTVTPSPVAARWCLPRARSSARRAQKCRS
jgi:N-carbamoylputrescine amidase